MARRDKIPTLQKNRYDCLLEGVTNGAGILAEIEDHAGRRIAGVRPSTSPDEKGVRAEFNLRLPEGQYTLRSRPSSRYSEFDVPISVTSGQKELDFGQVSVPATGAVALKGTKRSFRLRSDVLSDRPNLHFRRITVPTNGRLQIRRRHEGTRFRR